jgi:hypothetical protein
LAYCYCPQNLSTVCRTFIAPSRVEDLHPGVSDVESGVLPIVPLAAWRSQFATHHATRHKTSIHNTLSNAPQLSISQKALGTLPEDGNVMPKHVGAFIHN